jgi:group I intron endonuclease
MATKKAGTWLVYRVTCTTTNRSYIGITKNGLHNRWSGHLSTARGGSPVAMARAIRKYGPDDFVLSVLAIASDFDEASLIERAFIAEHQTMVPNGYNLTTGGEATHGRLVAPEARERMSAAAKARTDRKPASPETRARMSAGRRAIMSPEMKENIGAAHRGKTMSPETRAKLRAATIAQWERLHSEGYKRPFAPRRKRERDLPLFKFLT